MNPEQQEKFAAHLRECLSLDPEARLLSFKQFAARVLGREIGHWRDLSLKDARTVMKAANRYKPKQAA